MSGSFSQQLESLLLNHTFAGVAYPMPAALYVGLLTTAPGQNGGGGVEVSGGGYQRMQITFSTASPGNVIVFNTAPIQWPAASASWGTIVAGGLYDHLTGVLFLGGALLMDPVTGNRITKTVGAGDMFRIPMNGLAVGFLPPGPLPPVAMMARTLVRPIPAEVVPQ